MSVFYPVGCDILWGRELYLAFVLSQGLTMPIENMRQQAYGNFGGDL